MILDYGCIELEGKKVFEKVTFKNEGRFEKVLENEACFMFLLQGSFNVRTPVKTLHVCQNEGFLTKCGEYFFEDLHSDEDYAELVEVVAVYFHPYMIRGLFQTKPVHWNNNVTSKIDITESLGKYKEGLLYYINNTELFNPELQLLKIKELVLLLFQSSDWPSFDHYISALFSPSEYGFIEIIEKNCTSSLTLSQMASLCNMSLSTFKRRFKEAYNKNPSHYIKVKKLEKAGIMLKSTHLKINEIAFDCGFESIRSFNRIFKDHFGLSPVKYRLNQTDWLLIHRVNSFL